MWRRWMHVYCHVTLKGGLLSQGLAPRQQAALAELYDEFAGRLRRFVAGRMADSAAAEDVVQDVFVSLATTDIAAIENPSGWLYRVARNSIIDWQRSAQRRETPSEEVPELPEVVDEDEAIWDEIAACLQPFMGELTDQQRTALELTDLGGMTQTAAAAQTGISVAGMKSRVQRGRAELLAAIQRCCIVTLDGRGRPIDWQAH